MDRQTDGQTNNRHNSLIVGFCLLWTTLLQSLKEKNHTIQFLDSCISGHFIGTCSWKPDRTITKGMCMVGIPSPDETAKSPVGEKLQRSLAIVQKCWWRLNKLLVGDITWIYYFEMDKQKVAKETTTDHGLINCTWAMDNSVKCPVHLVGLLLGSFIEIGHWNVWENTVKLQPPASFSRVYHINDSASSHKGNTVQLVL